MGVLFSGTEGNEKRQANGLGMDEVRWEALTPQARKSLSRGGGAETQCVPKLAAGTRVYPEPEDC